MISIDVNETENMEEYGNNNEYLWSKPACGYLPEIIKLGVQVKKN